jgi:predicted phosphodiesterase
VLRFLHISDIHFATAFDDAPEIDVDAEVRERMLVDFGQMRERCGTFDAILVVGDIAARGKEKEFKNAEHFLASAAEIIGCPSDRVICVPGNHDVDRNLQVPAHQHVRSSLRSMLAEGVSDAVVAMVREPLSSEVLLRPFTEYNKFALAYDCDLSGERPMWPPKSFPLGDRSVEVHGVTSSWIADGSEAPKAGQQLVSGVFQAVPVRSDASRVCVALCHHPPSWLLDGELMKPWLAQASLVLTGHEHVAGLTMSDDERTLYIASGAVNPERTNHGWVPAYNVIELDDADDEQVARVLVYVRVWQGAYGHAEFGRDPDRGDPEVFNVKLGAGWDPPLQPPIEAVIDLPPEPITSAKHSQVHTIMTAAPDERLRTAKELGLELSDGLMGLEADREILHLAHENGLLAELAARLVQGGDNV